MSGDYDQRILWNIPTPLKCNELLEHAILDVYNSEKDVVATCITLEGVNGVSVAHCHGGIEAIHIHRKGKDSSYIYRQVHEFVTWMYCRLDCEESIVGIWLMRHLSRGTGLLVGNLTHLLQTLNHCDQIETASKVAWLCPYIERCSPRSICQLALPGTKAIYHTSCMQRFGTIPAITQQSRVPWEYAQYNLPEFPNLLQGHCKYEWSFSAASLNDVQAVRSCPKGGIELRYEDCSQCLGDFRPCEALDWCENPAYLKVSSISQTRYMVRFFKEKDKNAESELLSLSGKQIIFWSNQSNLIIEVKGMRFLAQEVQSGIEGGGIAKHY